jgi:hypothetical protein
MSSYSTASITSTPSSISSTKNHALTTTEIVIIIASVASGVLLILILVYIVIACRPRRQKYHRPENTRSQVVDVETTPPASASKPSKDDLYSKDGYRSPPPVFVSKPVQDDLYSVSLKDRHRSPPFVNNYESLTTHESHIVSLGGAQRIKLAPLKIPQKPSSRSNGLHSNKRTGTHRLSNLSLEADDASSVYSEASAYLPEPSLPSFIRPPMPTLPLRFNKSTSSILPKNSGSDAIVISRKQSQEEPVINSFPPPSLSAPPPSLTLNEDEEAADQTEIYNVAKLLHSRQAKLPKRSSRRFSTVSHIERSGSIRSSAGEPESEAYRPRYNRLKQKKDTMDADDSYLPNPFPVLPATRSQDSL